MYVTQRLVVAVLKPRIAHGGPKDLLRSGLRAPVRPQLVPPLVHSPLFACAFVIHGIKIPTKDSPCEKVKKFKRQHT